MAIPPTGESLHRAFRPSGQFRLASQGRRPPRRCRTFEHCGGHRDEVFHSGIRQTLPAGIVQRKLPSQPENVPRIDGGPAGHRPKQQVIGIRQQIERDLHLTAAHRFLRSHGATHHTRGHSRRGRRYPSSHPLRGLATTQPRKH